MRHLLATLVAGTALAAGGIALAAPSAGAHEIRPASRYAPIYAYDEYGDAAGSAQYETNGDHFYLCDHKVDGRSVVIKLKYTDEQGRKRDYDRWNWWGPHRYNGCKDINLAVDDGKALRFTVCLGVNGHPGGKPGKVVSGTCSGEWIIDHP